MKCEKRNNDDYDDDELLYEKLDLQAAKVATDPSSLLQESVVLPLHHGDIDQGSTLTMMLLSQDTKCDIIFDFHILVEFGGSD